MQPAHYIKQLSTQNILDVSDRPVIVFGLIPLTQQPVVEEVPTLTAAVGLLRYALLPVVKLPV